jgi:hypothetical protein
MTKRVALFNAAMIAEQLGCSKEYIHKLKNEGRIEKPLYTLGQNEGWDADQVEEVKRQVIAIKEMKRGRI